MNRYSLNRAAQMSGGIVLALLLSACSALPIPTSAPTSTPFVAPTFAPQTIAPAPTAQPTPPPAMAAWPLSADLFYLSDDGQVRRIPLAGDETAAVQVSRAEDHIYDFALAPGGEWMIYRTDAGVSIAALGGQGGILLAPNTGNPPVIGRGQTVAWSPDGAKAAYVTASGVQVYIPGAGANFTPLIFDIPTPESPVVDLAWSADAGWLTARRADGLLLLFQNTDPVSLSYIDLGAANGSAWLADGRLAFAPTGGGLALVQPDNLDSREFLVPQDRQVSLPFQRPDGSLAFFVHQATSDTPAQLYTADPLALTFAPQGDAAVSVAGLGWDPAGERLAGPGDPGTIRVVDPISGAQAVISAAGTVLGLDWADLPPRGVGSLPLPADLYFLAPQAGIVQVWRLPAGGDPSEAITSATSDVLAYDISADGSQIAYTSGGAIYHRVLTSSTPVQVALIDPAALSPSGTPAFSPDGRQLAFANGGIWLLNLDSLQLRRMVADVLPEGAPQQNQVFDRPHWSPDGRWLLVTANYYQGYDFALIPTVGSVFTPVFLQEYNARAEWSAEGLIYAYADGSGFTQPHLASIQPGRRLEATQLLGLPILDVELRPDGHLAFLRKPGPSPFGPTSFSLWSVLPDGTEPVAETDSLVMEEPLLSPDAVLVAGLVQVQRDDTGRVRGLLMIVNPATGEMFVLEEMPGVHALKWGR